MQTDCRYEIAHLYKWKQLIRHLYHTKVFILEFNSAVIAVYHTRTRQTHAYTHSQSLTSIRACAYKTRVSTLALAFVLTRAYSSTHAHLRMHIHARMRTCIHPCNLIHACTHTHACTHSWTRSYASTLTLKHSHAYARNRTHMRIRTHKYYIYVYIHKRIYAHEPIWNDFAIACIMHMKFSKNSSCLRRYVTFNALILGLNP